MMNLKNEWIFRAVEKLSAHQAVNRNIFDTF